MTTYTITARSGDAISTKVKISDAPIRVLYYKACLLQAFRNIEIINDETGEVMFTHYESGDLFVASKEIGEVVAEVHELYRNFHNR